MLSAPFEVPLVTAASLQFLLHGGAWAGRTCVGGLCWPWACAGVWPHPSAEKPRPHRAAALHFLLPALGMLRQLLGLGAARWGSRHAEIRAQEERGGLGGCHSVGFASRALTAALPAATRASLGEVRVVVHSFLFYILLCHAAPAAERARNSCQSREVSLQGLYSWLAGVTQS